MTNDTAGRCTLHRRRVCIVGGGFSGAVTAAQLARIAPAWITDAPLAISIIEPRETLGGGTAYSATDPSHRINVPAAKMTVFAEDPTQFDRWARAEGRLDADPAAHRANGTAFPQRAVFGRYIAGLVAEAARTPGIEITHERTRATAIAATNGGYTIQLANGHALAADLVVLAVSHPPPSLPAALREAHAAGAPIVADPWAPGALDSIPAGARVLIVGTGLTMADAVATLHRRAHRGPILAISRRGLLSRGHPAADPGTWTHFAHAPAAATALDLSRAVRAQVRLARAGGVPWQAVFDDIRANAGGIWGVLPLAEKRRLIRHLRPFWDVHRFRISPQAEDSIATLQAAGTLSVQAAALLGASFEGGKLTIRLKPRGRAAEAWAADAVIVTTGPAHGTIVSGNPALASLAAQGLLRPDPTGLGIDVDAANHAIGADGSPIPTLLVAGPLARGRVGELMGLPQVSLHAEAVAREVAGLLG